jgi:uncharacterized protein
MDGHGRPGVRGNGLVVGSVGPSGRLLCIATAHPRRGLVELTAAPAFDERDRFDPDAVRGYRNRLTEERFAVLAVTSSGAQPIAMTWAEPGEAAIRQRWWLDAGHATLEFRGALRPPVLAEITEAGARPAIDAPTRLHADGARLVVTAPGLPASAALTVAAGCWTVQDGRALLRLECSGPTVLEVCCALPADGDARSVAPTRAVVPDGLRTDLLRLREAALRYVTECTALRVGDAVCLLTDHRLLPLGWIRDAYYQAALLLSGGRDDLVAAHLRWTWLRAERRAARWMRSYLPTGAAKDARFQADQQLYPLLELVDYVAATGSLPTITDRSWDDLVSSAWLALPVHDGLVWTEENAADDRAELPYLAPAQLLRAHTAGRLAALTAAGHLSTGIDFAAAAGESRQVLADRFVTDGPDGPMWAYALDADGRARHYQDANDLPTALAPLWGLCPPDDPVWQATMRFAFSPANPGFAPGPAGGLGSVHTPGTWPLGDLQEWVWAGASGDWPRVVRVLRRLLNAAYPDGMLPEAYDPVTGAPSARPWFAWPGAALGALAGGWPSATP